jgi:hypothetical protein
MKLLKLQTQLPINVMLTLLLFWRRPDEPDDSRIPSQIRSHVFKMGAQPDAV